MMDYSERRKECKTDTQHVVNLSAYSWVSEQLGGNTHLCILDAACGSGYGSHYLANKCHKIVGIDNSAEAIKYCRKKYSGKNLLFLYMDCRYMGFMKKTFDAVISFETIEHIREDHRFLNEINRVMKDHGILILSTPHNRENRHPPLNPFHIREYSSKGLYHLLSIYFKDIRLFGRHLSPELAELERSLDKVRKFDKYNVRKIVPRRLRHFLGSVLGKLDMGLSLSEVGLGHVQYTEDCHSSKTLLAICRK